MGESTLTAQRLRALLHYDGPAGVFTWRVNRKGPAKAGNEAGSKQRGGYIEIGIDGCRFYAHRLAWLYMTGRWPRRQIDHKDRDRANNHWPNLREAINGQNACNGNMRSDNKSGYRGVFWNSQRQGWHARIGHNGRQHHLGVFGSPEEASAKYQAAAQKLHGNFAAANNPQGI